MTFAAQLNLRPFQDADHHEVNVSINAMSKHFISKLSGLRNLPGLRSTALYQTKLAWQQKSKAAWNFLEQKQTRLARAWDLMRFQLKFESCKGRGKIWRLLHPEQTHPQVSFLCCGMLYWDPYTLTQDHVVSRKPLQDDLGKLYLNFKTTGSVRFLT